ncbi:MAG: PLP-dependent aspartate aminotransferase family protein [Gemmatimonadota bacterium]
MVTDYTRMRFETKAIHLGQDPEPVTGAVVPPIHQASTFHAPDPSQPGDYRYSRVGNPTVARVEAVVAGLEGARFGLAFGSGMAAIAAAMSLLEAGDHVLCTRDVYGTTFGILEQRLNRHGIEHDFVDMVGKTTVEIEAAMRPNTRLVWIETPTNPLLKIIDIRQVAEMAHGQGALLGVDNTFASPYFQSPLALGADLVMHSCTKYLGGHSDLVSGMLVMNDPDLQEELLRTRRLTGGILGPFDAWLLLRGVKTLAIRMEAHQHNASRVAAFLDGHPRIRRTHFPGLESHPQHDLARRQMRGFSGMVTVEMDGGPEAARRFVAALRIFTSAVSLGGVESLAEIPYFLTHQFMQGTDVAIDPATVRLSVGLEHAEDLLADLDQALSASALSAS